MALAVQNQLMRRMLCLDIKLPLEEEDLDDELVLQENDEEGPLEKKEEVHY